MILTGNKIKEEIAKNNIKITPLEDSQIAQCSVDLHLHPKVFVVPDHEYFCVTLPTEEQFIRTPSRFYPNQLYLAATIERVWAKKHVIVVDGKSSLARLGVQVHLTAGYVEPGFDGQITLEIRVTNRIYIPPGWPICQIRFHEVLGEIEDYQARGNYADATIVDGPSFSKSYKHRQRHVLWKIK